MIGKTNKAELYLDNAAHWTCASRTTGCLFRVLLMLQGMFCVTHVTRDSCYTFSVPRIKSSSIQKSLVNIFFDGEYVGGNKKMTTFLSMDI